MKGTFTLVVVGSALSTIVACAGDPEPPPTTAAGQPTANAATITTTRQAPMTTAPATPEKRVITTTTKSPEARDAFLRAWQLNMNGRGEEALVQCKTALAADSEFALAHTCVGMLTPGAAGQVELDKGAALAAALPDGERSLAEAYAAFRRLDVATGHAKLKHLIEVAPDDYR